MIRGAVQLTWHNNYLANFVNSLYGFEKGKLTKFYVHIPVICPLDAT